MWQHTVAILIGGQSKRMGSPKHQVKLSNGRTMLEMMLLFANSFANHTVILGGDIEGQHCIHDLRKQLGPVGGIEALLHSNVDTNYLVVGCDMPAISEKEIQPLLNSTNNAVFSFGNRLIGLPLLINNAARATCTAYLDSGGRSIKGLVSEIPHETIVLTEDQSITLQSVNCREDLDSLTFE